MSIAGNMFGDEMRQNAWDNVSRRRRLLSGGNDCSSSCWWL